jgi:flavodoxin
MTRILVAYCSMTGNTKAAAEAVADGARSAGAQVVVKKAADVQPADLRECDAAAFGTYDAFGYMGGELKYMFDRAFYPTQGQLAGKHFAAFVTHGGGGKAAHSVESVAQALRLKRATNAVLVTGRPEGQAVADLKALGAALVKSVSA